MSRDFATFNPSDLIQAAAAGPWQDISADTWHIVQRIYLLKLLYNRNNGSQDHSLPR
jgi:hypothetical protein